MGYLPPLYRWHLFLQLLLKGEIFCTEESQFSVDAGVNGGERDVDIHTLKRKSYHPSTAVDH